MSLAGIRQVPQTPTKATENERSAAPTTNGRSRGQSNGSIQQSPERLSKAPVLSQPEVRLQEAPMSPVSVSPPRRDIPEPSFAQVRTASPRSNLDSRRSSRNVQTPDSGGMEDSVSSLPIRTSRPASGGVKFVQERPGSRASSSSMPRIEDFGGELHPPEEEAVGLQYLAFDDAPRKRKEKRASHVTVQSGSSSGGSDHRSSQLHVPGTALARPTSTYTLGSDLRGRTLSPLSANGSDPGSPASYARDLSSSRRSPNSRPVSYIDLLQNIPYSQQVAPGHNNNNQDLQNVVGNAASLLNTKKTLEMYRANVKKTKDPAIQYEFAIFMVNAARDEMLNQEPDSNPAELIKEAKHILQGLSDRAYPFAQYYLGDGYFSGLFNKDRPDWNSAFPLFVAASKHGHAEAGYRAALCYEFGWGTSKSYPKAIQFYRNAASKNHPGAATRLGMACLKGDMGLGKDRAKEGFKWLKRAQESADLQYNEAPFELGVLHLTGHGDDIFKDEAYAAQLLTQAAELGHAKANFLMGQAYENGQMGCPRDPALSVHFYNGAATRGVPEAMMALCAWYMVGAAPVLEKDEVEACEWAKKAAECGFPKAEYAVGYFMEMGIGCRRDPLEANVWYVRAADSGNENAKHRLAIIRQAVAGAAEPGVPMSKEEARSKELGGKEKGKWKFW